MCNFKVHTKHWNLRHLTKETPKNGVSGRDKLIDPCSVWADGYIWKLITYSHILNSRE